MRVVVQRLGVLAAIALLALLVAFALTHKLAGKHSTSTTTANVVPAPGSSWNVARAGILGFTRESKLTACGVAIGPDTYGVAHPSLPCGARIFVAYRHTQVLTEVLDRGPYLPGLDLALTPALARKLGVTDVTDLRWRFASPPATTTTTK